MATWIAIILIVLALIAGLAIGFFLAKIYDGFLEEKSTN